MCSPLHTLHQTGGGKQRLGLAARQVVEHRLGLAAQMLHTEVERRQNGNDLTKTQTHTHTHTDTHRHKNRHTKTHTDTKNRHTQTHNYTHTKKWREDRICYDLCNTTWANANSNILVYFRFFGYQLSFIFYCKVKVQIKDENLCLLVGFFSNFKRQDYPAAQCGLLTGKTLVACSPRAEIS